MSIHNIKTPKGFSFSTKDYTAKLEFNSNFGSKYSTLFNKAQETVDSEVMRYMEPYMQLDSSTMIKSMINTTKIGSGQVKVNTPYSRRVFLSKAPIGRPTGPLRGPNFFERMKADHKQDILNSARRTFGGG